MLVPREAMYVTDGYQQIATGDDVGGNEHPYFEVSRGCAAQSGRNRAGNVESRATAVSATAKIEPMVCRDI